jgi:hypothetical protein
MYSTEARKKYAELLKTATETLAPVFGVKVEKSDASKQKGGGK